MIVLTPEEQEAIARVGDDWVVLNATVQELRKQNALLQELVVTQKKQLEVAEQILSLEKERVVFYKEALELEKENHKRDVEFMRQIIADQRELIKAAKPSFFERLLPIVGIIATLATLVL